MQISKKRLTEYVISLFLVLYGTTATLIRFVLPSAILLQGFPTLILGLSLLMYLKKGKIPKGSFLIIAMMIVYLVHNQYVEDFSPRMLFPFLVMLFMLMYSYYSIEWAKSVIRVSEWIYLFYGVCTILFYFTPDFYSNVIVNLFPNDKARLLRVYSTGSMPGLTEHYSTNAMFLSVGLCIIIASYFAYRRKNDLFKLLLMIIALLLTGKRGHVIFIFAAFFAVYYMVTADKKNRFVKWIGMIITILCIGAVLVNVFPPLAQFIVRFQETAESGDITLSRIIFWERAIDLFKENPIFGIGWCNFMLVQQAAGYTAHVHNVYLQLLCETGIVGLVIYTWWMASSFIKTGKALKFCILNNIDFDGSSKFFLYFSFGFQFFFLLYSLTGNPLYDEEMYIPYFICNAMGLYYFRRTKLEDCT